MSNVKEKSREGRSHNASIYTGSVHLYSPVCRPPPVLTPISPTKHSTHTCPTLYLWGSVAAKLPYSPNTQQMQHNSRSGSTAVPPPWRDRPWAGPWVSAAAAAAAVGAAAAVPLSSTSRNNCRRWGGGGGAAAGAAAASW
jgi:hypothetical protein